MGVKFILVVIVALALFHTCPAQQLKTDSFNVYSNQVRDSFTVRVSFSSSFNNTARYSSVYYLDADITSGNDLRSLLAEPSINARLGKTLFIGIAHKSIPRKLKYPKLRSRDFIPPSTRNGKIVTSAKVSQGHADLFYAFLTTELIPLIQHRFNVNNSRTIIGHSLGGLFVFYCLFKKDQSFKNYIALSPALWVNRFNIFTYEQQYRLKSKRLNSYLYFSTGTREVFNVILPGTRRMKKVLQQRKYEGFRFDYFEHEGKKHFSQIPVSLSYVLTQIDF
jgi:predicted alpha/beta superfamily hydrolase